MSLQRTAAIVLASAVAGWIGYSIRPVPRAEAILGKDSAGSPSAQAHEPRMPALAQAIPTCAIEAYRNFTLEYDVEYRVQVYVGAVTQWIADDNPKYARGSLVRPISIKAVATRKDSSVGGSHVLEWREVGTNEGFGMSMTVLGRGFDANDPEATPRSSLEFDVRPVADWGSVRTEEDLLVSAALSLAVSQPLEHPKPMVPHRR